MQLRSIVFCISSVQALTTVNYGAFTQTATYSIANQLGFFTALGLNVNYLQVPNSTYAFQQVLNGGYDILTATIDNAVNFRFNSKSNVTVVGQLDQGPDLVLASTRNITSVAELKGRPIIVDSPLSGYAYLLRKVLSSYGLLLENGDYYFMTVGGTNLRYADLIAGELPNGTAVYATILTYPFTAEGSVLPAAQRPNVLARVSDFVNPISSSAFTTRQSALSDRAESDKLTSFLSAMYAANVVLLNPSKKKCAIAAIQKQLGVTNAVALLEYKAAINSVSGEISPKKNDFTVNQAGLQNVIAVRKQFGGFTGAGANFDFNAAIVPGKGKLIDYSIRDAAVKNPKASSLAKSCYCD